MPHRVLRGPAACLLLAICSVSTGGCAYYGGGSAPPSVLNEPPPNLASRCQIANRDVLVRTAQPELRGYCGAWSDRQTAVLGL